MWCEERDTRRAEDERREGGFRVCFCSFIPSFVLSVLSALFPSLPFIPPALAGPSFSLGRRDVVSLTRP